jgi:hypothetical protein
VRIYAKPRETVLVQVCVKGRVTSDGAYVVCRADVSAGSTLQAVYDNAVSQLDRDFEYGLFDGSQGLSVERPAADFKGKMLQLRCLGRRVIKAQVSVGRVTREEEFGPAFTAADLLWRHDMTVGFAVFDGKRRLQPTTVLQGTSLRLRIRKVPYSVGFEVVDAEDSAKKWWVVADARDPAQRVLEAIGRPAGVLVEKALVPGTDLRLGGGLRLRSWCATSSSGMVAGRCSSWRGRRASTAAESWRPLALWMLARRAM